MPTITKSIGSAGRDYATITLWEADLDNGAVYASGDMAQGEMYNDSAFDEAVTINGGGGVGLSAIKLTAPSGQRHTGIAGTGARIVRTTSGTTINYNNLTMPITISWLEINQNETAASGIVLTNANDFHIQNNLIHDPIGTSAQTLLSLSTKSADTPLCDIVNNIIYNISTTSAATSHNFGMNIAAGGTRQVTIANNTVWKIEQTNALATGNSTGISSADGSGRTIKNNIAADATNAGLGTKQDFVSFASSTTGNNLSSDATAPGSGSLTNKTSANQFVSTTVGAEDLHLKTGADAIDAGTDLGTTPTGVNFDIDNYDRDAGGVTWDIGADEFIAEGVSLAVAAYHLNHHLGSMG